MKAESEFQKILDAMINSEYSEGNCDQTPPKKEEFPSENASFPSDIPLFTQVFRFSKTVKSIYKANPNVTHNVKTRGKTKEKDVFPKQERTWKREKLSPTALKSLDVLGLKDKTMTLSALKRRYRELMRKNHPDLNANTRTDLTAMTRAYECVRSELETLERQAAPQSRSA